MHDGKSLRKAAKAQGISHGTFMRWVDDDTELADQYTRARARLLDFQAEELEAIGEAAAAARNPVKVAGLRLQSDNRKWLLAKLAPKKYGERLDLHHAGSVNVTRHELTDEQLEAIAAGGSAGAAGPKEGEGQP